MKTIIDWITEIDLITEKFKRSFYDFTEEEMNYKPKENSWSVSQNIAHIILLNSSYFEHFIEIQSGNHALPTVESMETLAQDSLLTLIPYTSSNSLERTNTWDMWQPSSNFIRKNILLDFEKSQFEFKKHIESFDHLPLANTFIKYPGHLDLIFMLDDCINFLIEHENRHWNQAVKIGRHS